MMNLGSQLGQTTPVRAVLLRGLFLGLIITLIPIGSAQDVNDQGEEDLDDLLGGFDDAPVVKLELPESPISKGWDVDGFMRTDMSYSIAKGSPSPGAPDYRGFSRLQTTLRLELPVTISENWRAFVSGQAFHDFSYGLKDRTNFTKALLDLYEDEAEIRDVYIGGSPWPWIDVKIGRQIIVWGAADYLRVVDVLNPLDNRQPGLVDIEDLRLPITMSRLDISVNNRWTLTGVAVHEVEFGNNPVFNGQFFPFAGAPPSETLPSRNLASTELAVSLNGSLPGMDVGLFWADYYDDTAHFETRGPDLGLYHSRLSMMGASVNGVLGDWLWKAETALVSGLEFNNSPSDSRSRLDGLVGFEYSGIRDTTLSLEVVNRHTDRDTWICGLPFWVGRIMASFSFFWRKFAYVFAILRLYLPRPLVTLDQMKLLETDNVLDGSKPGFTELGIEATTVESIVPTYLRRFRPYQQQKKLRLDAR